MSTYRKRSFFFSLSTLLLSGLMGHGQGLGNSPYSAQGIGEVFGNNNITNLGMGGLGVSYANGFFLNTANPALLARNRNTIFEVGLLGQAKEIADNQQTQRDFGANLSYLSLAFPVAKKMSMGLSLRPYSYVDYQTTNYQRVPGTIYEARYDYRGKGAINRASITNGFNIYKNLYVGAEASFLFGNVITDSESQLIINGVDDVTVSRSNLTSYSDIVWKLGAAWRPKLNKNWFMNVGATYDPGTKLRVRETDTFQQLLFDATRQGYVEVSPPDTVRNNQRASLTVPGQWRAGITLEKTLNIAVGMEVTYQPWSKYRTITGQSGNLNDSYSIAGGIEYLPKVSSSKYFNLVNYRAGLSYSRLPYAVQGQPVNDMSLSLGFSLPVGRFVNSVTVSLIGGQRGSVGDGRIRERYGRVGVSLSLNDRWFQRYKID